MEKTKYFTITTFDENAKSMHKKLGSQLDLHKDQLIPAKTALLILDMQEFFFNKNSHAFIPSANAIVKPILTLANIFINNDLPIITTKHLNTKENAKQMGNWWRDILIEESEFSPLILDIKELPNTDLIIKSQYDAFFDTNLHKILKQKNIEQVIITGVMTHLCCETTARSAFVNGYNVFFPIDGTATYNEDFHNATLTNLAHGFANITLVEEMIKTIDGQY